MHQVPCGVRAWQGWENHALCRPAEGQRNTPQPEGAAVVCIDDRPVNSTRGGRCVDPTQEVSCSLRKSTLLVFFPRLTPAR